MNVIRHHAPGKEPVSLTMKVADGIGHDPSDPKVAHVAPTKSAVEAALGLAQDGPELVEPDALRSDICAGLLGVFKNAALLAKLSE